MFLEDKYINDLNFSGRRKQTEREREYESWKLKVEKRASEFVDWEDWLQQTVNLMQQVHAFYINVEGFREKGHETEEWNGGGGDFPSPSTLRWVLPNEKINEKMKEESQSRLFFLNNFTRFSIRFARMVERRFFLVHFGTLNRLDHFAQLKLY